MRRFMKSKSSHDLFLPKIFEYLFFVYYLLGCTPKSMINAECQLYRNKIKKQHFPAGKDNQELPTSGLKEF